jgi:hypothetical protein
MIFKSMNNSLFKSPNIQYHKYQCSPIMPTLKTYNTRMIIDNYQPVFDHEEPGKDGQTNFDAELRNCLTPVIKTEGVTLDKQMSCLKNTTTPKKITINSSSNIFTQLNELNQNYIHSSLSKLSGKSSDVVVTPVKLDVPEEGVKVEFQNIQNLAPMNNVTNIYINYTFEDPKQLGKKRKRKASVGEKCVTMSTEIFNIQEIRVLGRKIKYNFPELADYNLEIIQPIYQKSFALLNKEKKKRARLNLGLMPGKPASYNNIINPSSAPESSGEGPKTGTLWHLEKDAMNIQRKLCLEELKTIILNLQHEYIFSNKSISPEAISKAAYYIDEINRLSEKLHKTPIIFKKTSKCKNKKSFKCDFCECVYANGQALGGHMSRSHPNQSRKYNMKKTIRDERSIYRDLIYQARKELFANHQLNYDEMVLKKENKSIIRQIRNENLKEYKDILDRLKKN